MDKKFKVHWAESAALDLSLIEQFISKDSPRRATEWLRVLFLTGESLSIFPYRGRIVPELGNEQLRELVIDNCRLVYRLQANTVTIVTIFEAHRRLGKGSWGL